MAQLNTRIILRNDSTVNWNAASTEVLLKGELGLEFLDGGKVKMKVGDGTKTWAELDYFGGEESKTFQVGSLDEITETNLAVGDTAIVKTAIYVDAEDESNNKYSYTGYVYNGTAWAAMDGNYSAENVYFPEDLTMTQAFGKYVPDSSGSVVVPAASKNIIGMLLDAYSEESDPSVDSPSVSLAASGGSGEVGTTYTLPTATVTIDDVGSYTYGSKDASNNEYAADDTGVTFAIGDVTISEGDDNSTSNTDVMVKGSKLTLKATGDSNLYGDSAVSYTFKATAAYTASDRVPVTNLGNKVDSLKIDDGSVTIADKTVSFTGWRKMFMGTLTDASTEITSDVIRGLTLINKQVATAAQTFTAAVGTARILVACPSEYSISKVEYFTMSWEDFAGFAAIDSVQVADARGGENGLKTYNVYAYTPAAALEADTQFRVTLKKN